jgi:hypothetical protein
MPHSQPAHLDEPHVHHQQQRQRHHAYAEQVEVGVAKLPVQLRQVLKADAARRGGSSSSSSSGSKQARRQWFARSCQQTNDRMAGWLCMQCQPALCQMEAADGRTANRQHRLVLCWQKLRHTAVRADTGRLMVAQN